MKQPCNAYATLLRGALVILLLAALTGSLAALAGCRGQVRLPRRRETPAPEPLGPVEIDWSSPGSVVEGFFDAKKRGDWRKAFDCCDFVERLGAAEAKKIRREWKKDAPAWPDRYRDSTWIILDETIERDIAIVSVAHIRWVGPGALDTKRTGFEELCKLYAGRWKITEFVVPEKESRN